MSFFSAANLVDKVTSGRYAPLLNLAAALYAVKETYDGMRAGDIQVAAESAFAAFGYFLSGPVAYTISASREMAGHINKLSAASNATIGVVFGLANYIQNFYHARPPSRSISFNFFPYFSTFQVATNLAEHSFKGNINLKIRLAKYFS